MAATSRLAILVALLAASSVLAAAQKAKAKPAAGPAADAADGSPPTDVTKVLGKSGQYTKFLQLLHDTRVDDQIKAQLTDSYNGLTIFAPTDAAFASLKSGTLNDLSSQDQIQLVLYCVLPRFYSLSMLGTLNGKVNTQGSGHTGPYKYSIKRAGNNVNVSTGVNSMLLGSPVSKDFPLAVYPVDKVPLPYELFGPKPPTPAPAPAPAPTKSKTKKHKKSTGIAEPPTADDATADDEKSAAAPGAALARWVAALGVLGGAVLGGLL
ncbi:fasciclin-like arabinogalactan protein 12 [Phragmites australis]|uniref:fasciclin-like arabinogalactan protein 12 n=1 Tax=Phragmites australis TaxID=29695 RepID=UPI002D78299D|nr:fasciclin-like arabinogalactan protein 12 [Phragmites australis]